MWGLFPLLGHRREEHRHQRRDLVWKAGLSGGKGGWGLRSRARRGVRAQSSGPVRPGNLTYVEDELAPSLPVHVIDKEAGQGFQEEAEDGHACAEADCVRQRDPMRVEDADVDDIQKDGDGKADQKLQNTKRGQDP